MPQVHINIDYSASWADLLELQETAGHLRRENLSRARTWGGRARAKTRSQEVDGKPLFEKAPSVGLEDAWREKELIRLASVGSVFPPVEEKLVDQRMVRQKRILSDMSYPQLEERGRRLDEEGSRSSVADVHHRRSVFSMMGWNSAENPRPGGQALGPRNSATLSFRVKKTPDHLRRESLSRARSWGGRARAKTWSQKVHGKQPFEKAPSVGLKDVSFWRETEVIRLTSVGSIFTPVEEKMVNQRLRRQKRILSEMSSPQLEDRGRKRQHSMFSMMGWRTTENPRPRGPALGPRNSTTLSFRVKKTTVAVRLLLPALILLLIHLPDFFVVALLLFILLLILLSLPTELLKVQWLNPKALQRRFRA